MEAEWRLPEGKDAKGNALQIVKSNKYLTVNGFPADNFLNLKTDTNFEINGAKRSTVGSALDANMTEATLLKQSNQS